MRALFAIEYFPTSIAKHVCDAGSWFVISSPDLSIALFRVTAITQMQNSRLHMHYVKHGVDIGTTVCHKWIVTMFIDPFHSLSPEFAYRILDMFFLHGPNFLIRLSVALIVYKPHAGAARCRARALLPPYHHNCPQSKSSQKSLNES